MPQRSLVKNDQLQNAFKQIAGAASEKKPSAPVDGADVVVEVGCQMKPDRSAYATACVRFRSFSRRSMPWMMFLIVRSE